MTRPARRENPVLFGDCDGAEMAAKKRRDPTCDDCYFRQEGLCALPGTTVCPTFRASASGRLSPPRQPQLVPRPQRPVEVGQAA